MRLLRRAASFGPCCRRRRRPIVSSRLTRSRGTGAERFVAKPAELLDWRRVGQAGSTAGAASAVQYTELNEGRPEGLQLLTDACATLLQSIASGQSVFAAELRPPRAELARPPAWTRGSIPTTRCGSLSAAAGRVPHRQRRRTEEEDNLRHLVTNLGRRRARDPRRAVSDVEAPARLLPARTPTARISTASSARGPRRRQASARRDAWSTRGSCARDPAARAGARARGLGQPARRSGAQVDYLLDRATAEFYLTQIVSHHSADRRTVPRAKAPRAGSSPRHLRRLLLPQRQSADTGRAKRLPAGARRGAHAEFVPARHRTTSARDRFACSERRARGTSTSATCRSRARRSRHEAGVRRAVEAGRRGASQRQM